MRLHRGSLPALVARVQPLRNTLIVIDEVSRDPRREGLSSAVLRPFAGRDVAMELDAHCGANFDHFRISLRACDGVCVSARLEVRAAVVDSLNSDGKLAVIVPHGTPDSARTRCLRLGRWRSDRRQLEFPTSLLILFAPRSSQRGQAEAG
jgi:hypothetical protein